MNQLIKDIPFDSRPREKAIKNGVKSLTDSELLAIIIKTGYKNTSAIELSNLILNEANNLYHLSDLSIEVLSKYKGISKVKATTILAAIELGRRANNKSELTKIKNAQEIFIKYQNLFKNCYQENLLVIFLNNQNHIIKDEILFKGSINQSLFHPREIIKKAIDYLAVKIILVHNHPSGNELPSGMDDEFTLRMIKCGNLVGISVIDHIIIGNNYYSYYDHKTDWFKYN